MPSLASPVTFNAENHSYWRGKKRLSGVSEIIQKVGLSKSYEGVSPYYAERGKATHLAIQFHLEGRLDPSSIDENVKPHFEAFLSFWGKRNEKILALEKPLGTLDDSFAGTPDLITEAAIYDWKCSKSHDRVAELQGQGYKTLSLLNGFPTLPFKVVELHDDGTFEVFDYGDGIEEWPSVMSLYRWRIKKR